MVLLREHGLAVKRAQAFLLALRQRATPGFARKIDAIVHVARLGSRFGGNHRQIFGPQRLHVLPRIGGHGFHFGRSQIGNLLTLKSQLEMFGQKFQILIVIVERRLQIVPRLIELPARGVVENVFHDEPVFALETHVVVEGVVLGRIVGGVEGERRRILVRGRRFAVRSRRQQRHEFQHTRFEPAVSGALHVADHGVDRNARRRTVGAVGKHDPDHLIVIFAHRGIGLELESHRAFGGG